MQHPGDQCTANKDLLKMVPVEILLNFRNSFRTLQLGLWIFLSGIVFLHYYTYTHYKAFLFAGPLDLNKDQHFWLNISKTNDMIAPKKYFAFCVFVSINIIFNHYTVCTVHCTVYTTKRDKDIEEQAYKGACCYLLNTISLFGFFTFSLTIKLKDVWGVRLWRAVVHIFTAWARANKGFR